MNNNINITNTVAPKQGLDLQAKAEGSHGSDNNCLAAFFSFMMEFLGSQSDTLKIFSDMSVNSATEQAILQQLAKIRDPREQKKFLERMKKVFSKMPNINTWLDKKIVQLKPYIKEVERAEAALKKAQEMIDYPFGVDTSKDHEKATRDVTTGKNIFEAGWLGFRGFILQKKVQQFFFPAEKAHKDAMFNLKIAKFSEDTNTGPKWLHYINPGYLVPSIIAGYEEKVCGGDNVMKRDIAKDEYNTITIKQASAAVSTLSTGVNSKPQDILNAQAGIDQTKSSIGKQTSDLVAQLILNKQS